MGCVDKMGDIVDDLIDAVLDNCDYEIEVYGCQDYVAVPCPDTDKIRVVIEKILKEK